MSVIELKTAPPDVGGPEDLVEHLYGCVQTDDIESLVTIVQMKDGTVELYPTADLTTVQIAGLMAFAQSGFMHIQQHGGGE